jgi:MFS family permease
MALLSFLDRDHSIAGEHYSRWLVPPAALAIHLSIGQAYAFSVFNIPLSQRIGVTQSAPADWKLSTIGWVFSVAIVFLGLSAALFGPWLERVGPRKAMFASALCFGGGFEIAALASPLTSSGCCYSATGCSEGSASDSATSPVTTSFGGFDRPGMATGMAIMASAAVP